MKSLLANNHGLTLHTENDALDVLSSGLPGCIFLPEDLHPAFFDLSNQIAGGIFQKFVNYQFPVAFVLPESHNLGVRVEELILDHRTHPSIRFFNAIEGAEAWLQNVLQETTDATDPSRTRL